MQMDSVKYQFHDFDFLAFDDSYLDPSRLRFSCKDILLEMEVFFQNPFK